jgi:hypothetical protein
MNEDREAVAHQLSVTSSTMTVRWLLDVDRLLHTLGDI